MFSPFTISDEMRQVMENQMQILAALAHLTDDGQSPPCTIPLCLEYCISQTRELLEKDAAEKAEIKRREEERVNAKLAELTATCNRLKSELAQLSNLGGATSPSPEPLPLPRYPVTICGIPQEEVKK